MLENGISSYGFRIIEKDSLGELLVDKLISYGIKPGPIYRKIKENKSITLNDGTIIHRKDFIGENKRGKIITILGDTHNPEQNKTFVENRSEEHTSELHSRGHHVCCPLSEQKK